MLKKYPDLHISQNISLHLQSPDWSLRRAGTAAQKSAERRSLAGQASRRSYGHCFLIYLNNKTWLGAPGIQLADQVPRPRTSAARQPPSHAPSAPCADPLQPCCSPAAATL